MESTLILAAFTLGLISSLHCVGMCGPIAFSLGLDTTDKFKFTTKNITYQLGRVTTYTILGGILGIFGQGISFVGYQKYLSIFVGIVMLLMLFLPKNLGTDSNFKFMSNLMLKIKIALSTYMRKKKYYTLYTTGLLNGLLPCGPVYSALTASLIAGGIVQSASFMFLFGLGTIPLMFATVLFGNFMSFSLRNKLLKTFPYITGVLAILFILRGLGLGIPYVSPKNGVLKLHAKECCSK